MNHTIRKSVIIWGNLTNCERVGVEISDGIMRFVNSDGVPEDFCGSPDLNVRFAKMMIELLQEAIKYGEHNENV